MKRRLLGLLIIGGFLLLGHSTAHAIPLLQLYVEDAWYDDATESWVAIPTNASQGAPFTLWAIGNVAGPGGKGTISGVHLAAAFDAGWLSFGKVTISVTPTWIGASIGQSGRYQGFEQDKSRGLHDYTDDLGLNDDGTIPTLNDGSYLPKHDAYGPGVAWREFGLGDFEYSGDSIADFVKPVNWVGRFDITGVDPIHDSGGQINAYGISVTFPTLPHDYDGEPLSSVVHFDLYNHVQAATKLKSTFAPFSHDAIILPEPLSRVVWLLIGLTWAGSAWMYRYYSRWRELEQEAVLATATCEGTLALRDEQAGGARSGIRAETAAEQHQVKD